MPIIKEGFNMLLLSDKLNKKIDLNTRKFKRTDQFITL